VGHTHSHNDFLWFAHLLFATEQHTYRSENVWANIESGGHPSSRISPTCRISLWADRTLPKTRPQTFYDPLPWITLACRQSLTRVAEHYPDLSENKRGGRLHRCRFYTTPCESRRTHATTSCEATHVGHRCFKSSGSSTFDAHSD